MLRQHGIQPRRLAQQSVISIGLLDRGRLGELRVGMEVWVRGNRRAYLAAAVLLLLFEAFCLTIALDCLTVPMLLTARVLAAGCALLAIPVLVLLAWHFHLPRLGYEDGHLLVYGGSVRPTRVPIEIVEVVFRGQGVAGTNAKLQTTNLVVRLAERAKSWQQRDMRGTFGTWKDGYISLSGVWCEPIDTELIHSLNRRLVEKKRACPAPQPNRL